MNPEQSALWGDYCLRLAHLCPAPWPRDSDALRGPESRSGRRSSAARMMLSQLANTPLACGYGSPIPRRHIGAEVLCHDCSRSWRTAPAWNRCGAHGLTGGDDRADATDDPARYSIDRRRASSTPQTPQTPRTPRTSRTPQPAPRRSRRYIPHQDAPRPAPTAAEMPHAGLPRGEDRRRRGRCAEMTR